MPSLTDGEVVQNFQSRALKLGRELDCVRRELADRQRELHAAEKVIVFTVCTSAGVDVADAGAGVGAGARAPRAPAGGDWPPRSCF